jgi:hypothetical protein
VASRGIIPGYLTTTSGAVVASRGVCARSLRLCSETFEGKALCFRMELPETQLAQSESFREGFGLEIYKSEGIARAGEFWSPISETICKEGRGRSQGKEKSPLN